MTFILFIVLVIWGIVQAWNGEWTTGLILWSLAWIMLNAHNAHIEASVARSESQRALRMLAEFYKEFTNSRRAIEDPIQRMLRESDRRG